MGDDQIGALTTITATVLGTATAFGVVRGRFPGKALVSAHSLADDRAACSHCNTRSTPCSWIERCRETIGWGLVAAHALLALPFVVVTVGASLRTFDIRLEDAAASLAGSLVDFVARHPAGNPRGQIPRFTLCRPRHVLRRGCGLPVVA